MSECSKHCKLLKLFTYFSPALGLGWRLGFLGLLHLDVFNQRLELEYNAEAILTVPSVTYKGFSFMYLLNFMLRTKQRVSFFINKCAYYY